MAQWKCECCSTDRDVHAMTTDGRYLAYLCRHCATEQHGMQRCLLCGGCVMNCQFVAHFSDVHPSMLQRLANMPESEFSLDPGPAPQRLIGTLSFGRHGEGLGDGN